MKVEIYEDAAGEHRWRMKAANGEIIAIGGEGFSSKQACQDSVANVVEKCRYAEYIEFHDGEETT